MAKKEKAVVEIHVIDLRRLIYSHAPDYSFFIQRKRAGTAMDFLLQYGQFEKPYMWIWNDSLLKKMDVETCVKVYNYINETWEEKAINEDRALKAFKINCLNPQEGVGMKDYSRVGNHFEAAAARIEREDLNFMDVSNVLQKDSLFNLFESGVLLPNDLAAWVKEYNSKK